jgi:hypothetical protein
MDPKFEKQLNETVKGSYQIKTTSQDILSKRAMKQPQKTPFYKRGFYLMTIALSATVIALAIYVPLSLRSTPTTSLNSLDPISSIGEIEVSPLKDDASSLAYEVRSLYPLIKKETSTESLHPSFQYWNDLTQDVFSDVVSSYEEIQAPIHEAFAADNDNLKVYTGQFTGASGTLYSNKMDFGDVGTLLFNTTSYSNSSQWSSLTGELQDSSQTLYGVEGVCHLSDKRNDLTLTLRSKIAGDYCVVSQDSTSNRFFFSYQVFKANKLSYTLSLRLLNANGTSRFVSAQFYDASNFHEGTYRVLELSSEHYALYGTGLSKILLSYENGQRIYVYNGSTLTFNN